MVVKINCARRAEKVNRKLFVKNDLRETEGKKVFFYRINKIDIGIAEENNAVTEIFFWRDMPGACVKAETPLIKKTAGQIEEYFAGKRKKFSLPLALRGTEFQLAVWEALQTIPYGETRSYGEIAVQIGRPKAARAVGMANHNNPVSIVVPCHRVIGHNGKLVGYGAGLPLKQHLLNLEKGNV
jgi:methylated-DNA-[protein]-cysteine S-methyltransferase